MRLCDFLEGVDILRGYYLDDSRHELWAESHAIGFYPTHAQVSEEDQAKLKKLGFSQTVEEYDIECSWFCRV